MIKKRNMLSLEIFCFISIVILIYSILTYSQTVITSDEAMQSFLARTILKSKSLFPKEWAYAMGDVWVLSTHTFILPFLFLKNQILARVLGNLVLFLVTIFGIYYQDKKIFFKKSYVISIPLFLLFLNGSTVVRGMRVDAMYTIYMLFITLLSSWIILIYKKIRNNENNRNLIKYIFYFCSLIFLISITGIRMLAYFTIPLIMTFLFKYYFEIKDKNSFKEIKKNTLVFFKLFFIILLPSLAGYSLHILIGKTHITNNVISLEFVQNIEEIKLAFIWYIETLLMNFGINTSVKITSFYGIQNVISIFAFFIIMIGIPLLQLKKIRGETLENKLFFLFAFFHILINFVGIVFLGEKQVGREVYTLTTIYMCQLISANYIMSYWVNKNNINRKIFILCFLTCSLVQMKYWIGLSNDWKLKLENQKYISNELLKHGLYKGYSSYWNAYNNNLYSNYKLKISALIIDENVIFPFKWLNDISYFEEEKNIKTFLLLNQEENKAIVQKLDKKFGKPVDSFMINDFYVYVFDYDIIRHIDEGLNDKRISPWEMESKGEIKFEGNKLLMSSNSTIVGSYGKIENGDYTLIIYGENLDKGTVEIFSDILTQKFEIKQKVKEISSSKVILEFSLKESLENIEFKIINKSMKTIKLEYMDIRKGG